jgi:hypothetical protein
MPNIPGSITPIRDKRLLEHPNHRIDELLPHRWTLATP